jgi:hypothetical protein
MSRLVQPLALVALALLAGCAHRAVFVESQPTGALVYINGTEAGRTPLKYDFDFHGDFDVVLRLDGYETLKTHQQIKTPVYDYPPLDLFAELFGVKEEYHWSFTLPPVTEQAVDPQQLIGRGEELQAELRSGQYTRAPSTRPAN